MDINSAFPSKYLKTTDLQGRSVVVMVARVEPEDVGDGEFKPILYMHGKKKGMILNQTNAGKIASWWGSETDDWSGKQLVLYPTTTEFRGKEVDCIRVKPAIGSSNPTRSETVPAMPASAVQPPAGAGEPDDSIPF